MPSALIAGVSFFARECTLFVEVGLKEKPSCGGVRSCVASPRVAGGGEESDISPIAYRERKGEMST